MSLRSDMQQNIQGKLNFSATPAGETREAGREETESRLTTHAPERPAGTTRLMEEICDRENLKEALRRVKANKGSPGIDGSLSTNSMTIWSSTGQPSGNNC